MGRVEPNPCVGCVLADEHGRVVAIGHHRRYGGPHAEVEAVRACRDAGVPTRGLSVYCTLEPCGHTGKTGPCADLLIEAGVSRVVCARPEPTALAGGGAARLRGAGIDVRFSGASRAAWLAGAPHAKRTDHGLPWVIAKWAESRDGYVAAKGGEPRWISNAWSRRRVHALRARVDAVVVGVGTVEADDPALTARGVPVRRVARRVVLDTRLRIPPQSRLVREAADPRAAPVTVLCSREIEATAPSRVEALRDAGVEVIGVGEIEARRGAGGRVDVREALAELVRRHDATRVLVEAGPTLTATMLHAGLVDEAHVHVGRMDLGTRGAVRSAGEDALAAFELWRERRLGGDVLRWYGKDAGDEARSDPTVT